MRATLVVLSIALVVSLSGCGKKGEIQDFGTNLKQLATELADQVDSTPTGAGVDEAHRVLRRKQAPLLDQWAKLKTATLNQDEKSALLSAVVDSEVILRQVGNKHLAQQHSDPFFGRALASLQQDFETLFNPTDVH